MSADELDFSVVEQDSDEELAGNVAENVAEDIVYVSRGNVIANEEHTLLTTFAYATGWCFEMSRYDNTVLIGPSSGGKTQVQKCAKRFLPSEAEFSRTNASGQALLETDEWDDALVAPMDEYDKLNGEIRKYMKSMAGEDEGMSRERSVRDENSETGFDTATLSSNPIPFQFLYATDNDAKAGLDHELANRMIELYVEDNIHIRQAIARKNHGHTDIEVTGLPHTYIYDTTEEVATVREHFRNLPVETDEEIVGYDGRRGGAYVADPDWIYYACYPIYNFGRTKVNRVSNQIANLIAGSTVLNHHERRTTEVVRDGERVEAYRVAPQDVANVLSCQEALLATTHNLDPRKRAILRAVNKTSGMGEHGGWTTLDRIREWLDDNDKPTPSESALRRLLKDELREDWFVRVDEGGGPNGADLFQPRTDAGVQSPRIENLDDFAEQLHDETLEDPYVDVSDPFADCWDPVRDQPFEDTVTDFEREIAGTTESADSTSTDTSSFMGGSDNKSDDESDGAAQSTLDGTTATSELPEPTGEPDGPVEQWLYERLRDTLGTDGSPFSLDHTVAHYVEAVHVDIDDPLSADVEGTVLDPAHELWSHNAFADDRVVDSADALRELTDAQYALEDKNLVYHDSDGDTPDGFVEVMCLDVDS